MATAPDPADHRTLRQRQAKMLLAVALAGFGIWLSATFIPALIWAAIIGIAIDPLYTRAESRWPGGRKAVLPGIATLLIALLVLAPLALGVFQATREAHTLIAWWGEVRATGVAEPEWLKSLPMSNELSRWWQENLSTPEAAQQFHAIRTSALIERSQLLGKGLLHRAIIFFFTLLALFFLLRDRDLFVAQLKVAGARVIGPSADRIGQQLILSVRGTIDGLVLVGIGEGAVMAVVYVIAGVPHPLLLGTLTAVAAMIPFGAAVLMGVASALLAGQGEIGWAIAVFAIGMGVVAIADHVFRPVLIGSATRLPFLWVLVGILGGVETMGLLGLFVGPAAMATLSMLWRDYFSDGLIDGSARSASPAAPPPPDCG
jgi:predicted PurR-regulated permease PerM